MEWRNACSWDDTPTDCGWWYWDDWSWVEFWVDCDEFEQWDWCQITEDDWTEDDWTEDDWEWCDNEWIWEECSWMYWRNACDWEGWSDENGDDCGWVYWDDWNLEEFWVTCDDFNSWTWCTEDGTDDWTDDD